MILGLCGLFWAVGVFWADLCKILVGSLLRWNSFGTQSLAGSLACFCFFLLALACLGWLWLALAALAAWFNISFMLGSCFAHGAQA